MTDQDFKDKELIVIKLPREDYEVLEELIEMRKGQKFFFSYIKSWWGFALAGGLLTLIALFDTIKDMIYGR